MAKPQKNETFSKKETERRFMATVRAALNTPPKRHSEMKIGKRKTKVRKGRKGRATQNA